MISELPKICHVETSLLAVAYAVIMILGSFSNTIVAVTYIKWRRMMLKEPRDILIFSLAVGDFAIASCVCPLGFASAVSKKWTTGHSGCVWYGFFSTWVGLSSMLQLAAIAVERYCTLSHAQLNPVSRKRAFQFTISSWLLSFVVSCCPLFGWSEYTFEGLGFHCSIRWSAKNLNHGSYSLCLLLFFFAVPITLISVSYFKIFSIVRRMFHNAEAMWGVDAEATRESYMVEVKIYKQLLVVTGAFLFAWTPYAVMSMVVAFTDHQIAPKYQVLPALFAKTSNIYNPVIYFFTYKRLRKKVFQLFKDIRSSFHSIDSQ